MLNRSVARRYAEAFFSIAQDKNKIEEYELELKKVVESLDEVENLREYFTHLLIPAKDKKELIQKLYQEQLSPVTMNFILMLIDKKRESYLETIYNEYVEMADESRDIKKAELIAASEVSDEVFKTLEEKLSSTMGKTIQLRVSVDPALLGGVKLRIGDQIIDGTIAKRLDMLKETLRQAKIS